MRDRPRFFDDLAGVAGGAFSAVHGLREEVHAMVRARLDEVLATFELVRRDEFEAVREMATRARLAEEAQAARITALEARLDALGSAPSDDVIAAEEALPETDVPEPGPHGAGASPEGETPHI